MSTSSELRVFITVIKIDNPQFVISLPFLFLQQADESLDFEEQILEAAKSIAAATSALVKSASAAQRELVAQGKVLKSRVITFFLFSVLLLIKTINKMFLLIQIKSKVTKHKVTPNGVILNISNHCF